MSSDDTTRPLVLGGVRFDGERGLHDRPDDIAPRRSDGDRVGRDRRVRAVQGNRAA